MSGKFNGMNNKKNSENGTVNREVGLKNNQKGELQLIRMACSFQSAKSHSFTAETFRRKNNPKE